MEQLEMIKAFGKLEGISVAGIVGSDQCCVVDSLHGDYLKDFNPITDLALNCNARDDYGVTVDYINMRVYIEDGFNTSDRISFKSKDELRIAIIECILKSKGLYK